MVTIPTAIPVTTPIAFTVAIEGFEETHGLTAAGVDVLDSVVVLPSQTLVVPIIVGIELTVITSVPVQPFKSVNVIVAIPKETPVTTPLAFTVAIKGFEDTQGFTAAGVATLDNVVVLPSQTLNVPVIMGTLFIVMVSVSVQPLRPVKVTITVPAEIPVTTPTLFTVANNGFEDTHGFTAAAAIVLDNGVVEPTQTFSVPEITGNALTVIIFVSVQPFKAVKVIVAVPAETPVTTPPALTVATVPFDETHGLTAAGGDTVDNVVVCPSQMFNVPVIEATAFTVMVSVSVHPLAAVKVIKAVPEAIPVTVPVAVTAATEGSEDTHGLTTAGVSVVDKMLVNPAQTENTPVITGNVFTTMVPVKTTLFPHKPKACTV